MPGSVRTVARSTPDDVLAAQLSGAASYAINHRMTREQAIAHLHAITTRPDLLARAAGIIAGASKLGMCDWPTELAHARLLVAAGADREALAGWIAQGIDNVQRTWAHGPVTKPDPELVAAVLAEVLDGLD